LRDDEVHVWWAALDIEASHLRSLQQTLAEEEQARAERFYVPRDRACFIAARGLLRTILGRYLGVAPGGLRFSYNPFGKPALAAAPGQAALRFNLSHSHGLAVYAVTRNREVGVDLERVRADFAWEPLLEQALSAREQAVLRALPTPLKQAAFFAGWTRKEAYLKARGEGLRLPLPQIEVSLAPGEPATLLSSAGDLAEARRWSLWELRPGPGYAAALAVEGHSSRLNCRRWPA